MAGYYQVQIQVRTTFIELFSEHPKSKGIAVSDRTSCILNEAYDGVKTGSKNTVFLEGATKIQAHTKQIIASIDKSIVNKNVLGKNLNINEVVNNYYERVLHLSEKSGLDSIELRRFNESYLSYSTPSDNMILQQQYHDLNDKETYIACLGKIKNDIKAIENDVISRLTAEIFTSLYGFTSFHPYVSAQSQLWQGDTLSAKIFIAEGTHIRTKVVIEKDTLDINDPTFLPPILKKRELLY